MEWGIRLKILTVKIRHKLTLYFTLTSAVILLGFGVSVYFFSAQYRKNEFFARLKTRLEITEKIYLEKEMITEESYGKIREQFLNSLPDETEEVVEVASGWQGKLVHTYPDEFLQTLAEREEAYFYTDTIQGTGRIFHLARGDFAVIITAVDKVGIRVLSNLSTIVMLALVICIAAIAIVSHFISVSLMRPISRKILKANSISVKNLHERLNVYNPDDELGELAIAFNNLLDRLDGSFNMQKLFVANASHEIRNPLTAILGEAEITLEKERTAAEYQEALRNISQEADRLNLLVNNLLQLSSVSYSPSEIKREDIAVIKLLHDAKKEYDLVNPENHVSMTVDADSHYGHLVIHGNFILLKNALINIFDNASKFSSNAEVKVELQQAGQRVEIIIKDRGVGIPAEDIPKITQPFFRAENVRQIRGTGIGIPLTLKIIELHMGDLKVESDLNVGTKVRITLPLLF